MPIPRPLHALAVTSCLAVACAHPPNANLARAHAELDAAESDSLVTENAPLLLQDARGAVAAGDAAWDRGESDEEVDHLAYVASRRVEIARVAAERKADVERADDLSHRLDLVVPERPVTGVRIQEIFFDFDRTTIPASEEPDVAEAADLIRADPAGWVQVDGYADPDEHESLEISQARASEVARSLIARGVDPARVATRGFADEDPVARTVSFDRVRNRRAEIVVYPRPLGR